MVDMESIGQRFKSSRTALGLSQEQLGIAIGVTKQTISAIERGATTKPEFDTVEKAARKMGLSSKWLMHGKGDKSNLMIRDDYAQYRVLAPTEGYIRFGLMEGSASAGYGSVNDDFPEVLQSIEIAEWKVRQQLGFIPSDDRVQILTVRGNSNYPKIKDGDVVMIDTSQHSFTGDDFYLINVHGFTLIKRLQIMGDGLHIRSTNPEYESEVIPANSISDIVIGGRILGFAQFRRSEEI